MLCGYFFKKRNNKISLSRICPRLGVKKLAHIRPAEPETVFCRKNDRRSTNPHKFRTAVRNGTESRIAFFFVQCNQAFYIISSNRRRRHFEWKISFYLFLKFFAVHPAVKRKIQAFCIFFRTVFACKRKGIFRKLPFFQRKRF